MAESKLKKFMIRLTATLICTVLGLWPTWLFILIGHVLSPQGFWQKFVVMGLGIWFLGSIQFIMVIILIGTLVNIIWD